jgi:hypothetical protein
MGRRSEARWQLELGRNDLCRPDCLRPAEVRADHHYYRFVPKVKANYLIYTRGPTDTHGELLDEKFKRKASDHNDGGGGNFRIAYEVEANRPYYVMVRGDPGEYSLHTDGPESSYSAQEVRVGSVAPGSFEQKGDHHYYRFVPKVKANYLIYTRGPTDTYGELLDEKFKRKASVVMHSV